MYRGRLLMGYRAFHLPVSGFSLGCVSSNNKPLLSDRCQKCVWKECISHPPPDPDGYVPKSSPQNENSS